MKWLSFLGLLLAGCSSPLRTSGISNLTPAKEHLASAVGAMDMLSWIAAVSILGGTAALILTRGAMGLRGVVIGFLCVLVNYAVASYADWIFVPVLIGTGLVSLAYAFRIVKQAIAKKQELNT